MFYLSLTTLIHENCLRTFINFGAMLIAISMCRAVVDK